MSQVCKYGPPSHPRPRVYHRIHELIETHANAKLTGEYHEEYVQTLATLEGVSSANPEMIDLQPEIQWYMRPFLIDFLIELHSSFKLQPQTLFLCLNIIDRYCAKRIVFKRHYQLVGCTALWIAGKYEDKKSRVPTLKELTIMCRHAYDEEMFVQMEMHILGTLEWSIGHPTLEDCLQLSIAGSHLSGPLDDTTASAVGAVARFLCELSLYDKFYLAVPTSIVAITAHLLACSMLQLPTAAAALKQLLEKTETTVAPFDDDVENKQPPVHGAFLSGLDDTSLLMIKKTALMLMLHLNKTTEVLSKKYQASGVIQVVRNYHSSHSSVMQELSESKDNVQLDARLIRLADILLQLHDEYYYKPRSPSFSSSTSSFESGPPVTPPSATSQCSVFSNKRSIDSGGFVSSCNTPTHASFHPLVPPRSATKIRKKRYGSSCVAGYSPVAIN
ncbi:uncharacterized protein LODBEIA_P56940 [Lodderomyces beijingensis]|uniref:Cyclin-like domain-containing protein n=1 Tax=Lodderomyces beijingensis TaxID=1775926 RepID=A0ABP0ZI43_9ASCO